MKKWLSYMVLLMLGWGSGLWGQSLHQLAPPLPILEKVLFQDSICVELVLDMDGVWVEWKQGEGEWTPYQGTLSFRESATIAARSRAEGYQASETIHFDVIKMGKSVSLVSAPTPSEQYPGISLTDGIKASQDFHHPQWMGFDQEVIVFKINASSNPKALRLEFLQDAHSWILAPEQVSVRPWGIQGPLSDSFSNAFMLQAHGKGLSKGASFYSFWLDLPALAGVSAWEVSVKANTLPPDHPGAGNKAWIFMDEILAY